MEFRSLASRLARSSVVAFAAALVLLLALPSLRAEEDEPAPSPPAKADQRAEFLADVCKRIEDAARERNLPPGFLARLIWKESRFDANAVSPKGASGIAQFMPGTAAERGLEDPFDPRLAIPASAHFLSDLRDEFGNLGLAAAAYNAGPNRVTRWRAGRTGLPGETLDFVVAITGYGAHDWTAPEAPKADFALHKALPFQEACRSLPIRRMTPRPFEFQYASATWQPWGVQVAAHRTPTRALAIYAGIQRKHPALLSDRAPMVVRTINLSMGRAPRFAIRIGEASRKEANAFCRKLRNADGACVVLKNRR